MWSSFSSCAAPRGGTAVKLGRHRWPSSEHYTPHLPLQACYMKCPFRQLALSSSTLCSQHTHLKNMHVFAVQSQSGVFLFYSFKWELVFFHCWSVFILKMWKLLRRDILMSVRKMTPLTRFDSWISRNVSSRRVFKQTVSVCYHCSLLLG